MQCPGLRFSKQGKISYYKQKSIFFKQGSYIYLKFLIFLILTKIANRLRTEHLKISHFQQKKPF